MSWKKRVRETGTLMWRWIKCVYLWFMNIKMCFDSTRPMHWHFKIDIGSTSYMHWYLPYTVRNIQTYECVSGKAHGVMFWIMLGTSDIVERFRSPESQPTRKKTLVVLITETRWRSQGPRLHIANGKYRHFTLKLQAVALSIVVIYFIF